jgi:hypothetical protein
MLMRLTFISPRSVRRPHKLWCKPANSASFSIPVSYENHIERTRQWPPLPYPMIPKAEKGNRFTDAEWDAFLAGTSPKPKLVQISS